MDLRGKHILLISPEGYHGLHMSKHHIAQGLVARGNRVCFWGPSPKGTSAVEVHGEGDLRIIHAPHWFKGVNLMPAWVNRWYYGRQVKKIAEAAGAPFDIIWCFDTSRLQSFFKGDHFNLLHLVDFDVLYQGHGLMRTADLIVTTADIINKRVLEIAPNAPVFKVGHALDKRWMNGSEKLSEPRSGPPRVALYSGQFMNTYIDYASLVTVAQAHPEMEFRYVGNMDPDFASAEFQQLRKLPNVVFAGLKNKDELLPLVREADILLFCFMTNKRMLERANPHKVLEYLSTGNVIVGTWTLEYEQHQGLLLMAPEPQGFPALFNHAVEHYAALNTREKREARIAFARTRTVDHVVDNIEELIKSTSI